MLCFSVRRSRWELVVKDTNYLRYGPVRYPFWSNCCFFFVMKIGGQHPVPVPKEHLGIRIVYVVAFPEKLDELLIQCPYQELPPSKRYTLNKWYKSYLVSYTILDILACPLSFLVQDQVLKCFLQVRFANQDRPLHSPILHHGLDELYKPLI